KAGRDDAARKPAAERLPVLEELARAYQKEPDPDGQVTEARYDIGGLNADRHFAAAVDRLKVMDLSGAKAELDKAREQSVRPNLVSKNRQRVKLADEALEK